jgi:hypothetical protein
MRRLSLVAIILAASAITATAADESTPGRYTLTPSANGFVRLDTQTGQVSECTGTPANLVCKSSPDERAAMQAEIDRLQKEIDGLKATTSAQTALDQGPQLTIPSDKDVDKAFNFMERMIKRFKGLIEEMRKAPEESTPL